MKVFVFLVLVLNACPLFALSTKDQIQENRVKIGPTINAPIEFQGKLYFLANTGVLYESNFDFSTITTLYQTELPTFCALTLIDGVLYFGEGLHDHVKTHFYAFDLKNKKLLFKEAVEGHIERAPLIKGNVAYLGLGPAGMGAMDLKTHKFIWTKKNIKAGKLHVDATPILYENDLCSGSIYDYKGIFCLNPDTGAELYDLKLTYSPKSEITRSGDLLFGFASEATMSDLNWKTPSKFFIVNLKEKKLTKEIELRGYNFFAPVLVSDKKAFVTLSTGDLITIALDTGLIVYVGEFPEPFVSSSFKDGSALCAFGIMGQLLCYKETKTGYAMTVEKRFYESPVGQITQKIKGKYYIPSRMGYFLL